MDVKMGNYDRDILFTKTIYFYDANFGQCGDTDEYDEAHNSYRPAIVLRSGIPLAIGNGLKTSPYVIN